MDSCYDFIVTDDGHEFEHVDEDYGSWCAGMLLKLPVDDQHLFIPITEIIEKLKELIAES